MCLCQSKQASVTLRCSPPTKTFAKASTIKTKGGKSGPQGLHTEDSIAPGFLRILALGSVFFPPKRKSRNHTVTMMNQRDAHCPSPAKVFAKLKARVNREVDGIQTREGMRIRAREKRGRLFSSPRKQGSENMSETFEVHHAEALTLSPNKPLGKMLPVQFVHSCSNHNKDMFPMNEIHMERNGHTPKKFRSRELSHAVTSSKNKNVDIQNRAPSQGQMHHLSNTSFRGIPMPEVSVVLDELPPMTPSKMFAYMKERERRRMKNRHDGCKRELDNKGHRSHKRTTSTFLGEIEDRTCIMDASVHRPEREFSVNQLGLEPADESSPKDGDPRPTVIAEPLLTEDPLFVDLPQFLFPKKHKTVFKRNPGCPDKSQLQQHDTGFQLRRWTLNFNAHGLYVDGIRVGDNVSWHTNLIVERISRSVLKTLSGRTYTLVGKMNMDNESKLPKWFLKRFVYGFPLNWKTQYENFVSQTKTEEMRTETRRYPTSDQPPRKYPNTRQYPPSDQPPRKYPNTREYPTSDQPPRKYPETREYPASDQPPRKYPNTREYPASDQPPRKYPNTREYPASDQPPRKYPKRERPKPFVMPASCPPAMKTTRSGRVIKPPLDFWKGGRVILDANMNVTIHEDYDTSMSQADTTATILASPLPKRRAGGLPRRQEAQHHNESTASNNQPSVLERKVKTQLSRNRNRKCKETLPSTKPAPKPAPAPKIIQQEEEDWTETELEKLREAVTAVPKYMRSYWVEVAMLVGTRSAKECQMQHTFLESSTKKAMSTKKKKEEKSIKEPEPPMITARVGTLKRKQQVRQFMEALPKEDHDDAFTSVAMQGRRFQLPSMSPGGEELGFKSWHQEPLTPTAAGYPVVNTPPCLHITPGMIGSVNRKNDDKYVFQLQKRMKKRQVNACKFSPFSKNLSRTPSVKRTMRKSGTMDDEGFVIREMFPVHDGADVESGEEEDFYFSD